MRINGEFCIAVHVLSIFLNLVSLVLSTFFSFLTRFLLLSLNHRGPYRFDLTAISILEYVYTQKESIKQQWLNLSAISLLE